MVAPAAFSELPLGSQYKLFQGNPRGSSPEDVAGRDSGPCRQSLFSTSSGRTLRLQASRSN
jgi:hypothetical protein